VLLVDDLPEARAALATGCACSDCVDEVDSPPGCAGARCSPEAAAGRPSTLLIDWRMVPMDGIQTLEAHAPHAGGRPPPALLVTAYNEIDMWRQAREARFDAVLVKPITASTLHDALLRVLRKARSAVGPCRRCRCERRGLLRRRHMMASGCCWSKTTRSTRKWPANCCHMRRAARSRRRATAAGRRTGAGRSAATTWC
jgi:two-component system sensor histidine kinase/response regulator